MTRNGQFHLIRNFSNLFPPKVAQNDSEQPILSDLQLFQFPPTEVARNDSEWPILHGQNKIHSDTRGFL